MQKIIAKKISIEKLVSHTFDLYNPHTIKMKKKLKCNPFSFGLTYLPHSKQPVIHLYSTSKTDLTTKKMQTVDD